MMGKDSNEVDIPKLGGGARIVETMGIIATPEIVDYRHRKRITGWYIRRQRWLEEGRSSPFDECGFRE